MRTDLPSGTVTFLFTDIEGSTRLLHALGAEAYADALAAHRRILREAFIAQGGVEVDTQGDAFFVAFPTAPGALTAAAAATEALAPGPIHVRMAIHTGTPYLGPEGYVGVDVHRGARIGAAGHGGQVLVSAATTALLGTGGLRDLGLHRLKDLSAPEHIFQLGVDDFPALKTLHHTNLPIPATPFLGRERELAEVVALLSRKDLRVLTLTGPGGTGKSRLALQAAAELSEGYSDGVFWVPLAPLREPELVLETAARAVGGKGGLAEQIGDRSMLLLFDNFEHVIEAATDLAGLLAACPNLGMLVTSREPLHVNGEQEYPVPPLLHEEGVDLFVARARAIRPDFQVDGAVSDICRRLDDLPLAIELAAARVKVLSSGQILERLQQRLPLLTGGARDLPERQRTLRATIAWSHDLLNPEEQRLFARLAIFIGGSTLEAAEEVTEADLDTLQSLVDKSLLRHTEERFWMLETIREYAAERLEASGEGEALRLRHAQRFLALAEAAEPHLRDQSKDWLDRLEHEHDNLRAAFDQLATSGESQAVLRLARALGGFWGTRGFVGEGRRRVEAALGADNLPTVARLMALNTAADMAMGQADNGAVILRAEEALVLSKSLEDDRAGAEALFLLGSAAAEMQDFSTARGAAEESSRLANQAGDDHQTMYATWLLGWAYNGLGDADRGQALTEEALGQARALGNREMQGMILSGGRARRAIEGGRPRDAILMLEEAYQISRDTGDRWRLTHIASGLARAFAAMGAAPVATRLLSSEKALFEEIGGKAPPTLTRVDEVTLALVREQLSEAAFTEAWEEGRKLTTDEAVALALESLGPGTIGRSAIDR
ncbi:MAG: adenylate/guanylate cyclase domain-containing protein [Candidatus Limnocylindrales bacterium]